MSGQITVTGEFGLVQRLRDGDRIYLRIMCDCAAERVVMVMPDSPPTIFACQGCGAPCTVGPV